MGKLTNRYRQVFFSTNQEYIQLGNLFFLQRLLTYYQGRSWSRLLTSRGCKRRNRLCDVMGALPKGKRSASRVSRIRKLVSYYIFFV